jgi:dolichol-phosphate mannosyltransferase
MTMDLRLPLISIVTPVLNEQENIRSCHAAIQKLSAKYIGKYRFEHVFTDNHSSDDTFAILRAIAGEDPAVRAFRFSRNFGYQRSIHAGFKWAKGNAAIQFDCDLQDPPEMVEKFIAAWEEGNQVVYGVRVQRQEGFFDRFLRALFYRMLGLIGRDALPAGAGDFRLLDRSVLNVLRDIHDNNIYLRGRIAALGFQQVGIPYARLARSAGKSKFNFTRNFGLAMDAVIAHSALPLRLASFFGLFMMATSILAGIGYIVLFFRAQTQLPPGFTTITLLILINLGLTSLFLGFLGEYVGRIYDHLKIPFGVIVEAKIEGGKSVPIDHFAALQGPP